MAERIVLVPMTIPMPGFEFVVSIELIFTAQQLVILIESLRKTRWVLTFLLILFKWIVGLLVFG